MEIRGAETTVPDKLIPNTEIILIVSEYWGKEKERGGAVGKRGYGERG